MIYDFKNFKLETEKIINYLIGEYKTIQTGSATPQVLDKILVEAYGSKLNISHIASINIESSENLIISPYDKSLLKDIEKAINEANLGVSTSPDGSNLRVYFPRPTTESRERMVKVLKEKLEESRVKVRSIREEVKKEIEKGTKDSEYGKDDEKRYLEELQNKVDTTNEELENLFKKKESEVLGN